VDQPTQQLLVLLLVALQPLLPQALLLLRT
jgi:hypothetical protein